MNLFEQQAANRRRSAMLVAAFVLFFAWIGFGGDLALWLLTEGAEPGHYRHTVPWIGLVAVAVAGGMAWWSWTTGVQRVLWSTGAFELVEPGTDPQRQLLNVVEEMAIAAGLPRPTVWVVPDQDPNAFATGLSSDRAHLAVTEGLLAQLDRDELQGVVAHEMAHIRNLDVRLMTVLAALLGAVALLSDGLTRTFRHGGRVRLGGRGGRGGKGGNRLGMLLLVLWVVSLVIAPALGRLLAMAVSRKREYLADATGAQLTRNPMALASALQKLAAAADPTHAMTQGAAHLCIVDPLVHPLTNREGWLSNLLASHPPITMRITRLRGMGFAAEKAAAVAG